MKLYDYFRSSACYRVRIALAIKDLSYEKFEVHLVNQGGEQHLAAYQKINPAELVPSLETDQGLLHQSLAIIDYLEDCYPNPPLLPADPYQRAQVRALALDVACEIHPLNNLRVLQYLRQTFKAGEEEVTGWYHHWLEQGFRGIEKKLEGFKRTLPVSFGESVSLADICLIPQVYNAKRFNFDLRAYPLIQSISDYCLQMPAFQNTSPG